MLTRVKLVRRACLGNWQERLRRELLEPHGLALAAPVAGPVAQQLRQSLARLALAGIQLQSTSIHSDGPVDIFEGTGNIQRVVISKRIVSGLKSF